MGKNYKLWVGLVVLGMLLYTLRGWGPELPYPGQELRKSCDTISDCDPSYSCVNSRCINEYPKEGECRGRTVTEWGRPTYHLDPKMQHMKGMDCWVPGQCQTWVPQAFEGDIQKLECCINTGVCYIE